MTFKVLLAFLQNAHAYVNAGFRIRLSEDKKQILGEPALVFGGIDDELVSFPC